MKRNKNKLSDKLTSIREGITLPDSENPLDEDIAFDDKEDKTEASSPSHDEGDGIFESTAISESSDVIDDAVPAATRVMVQSPESTSVLAADDQVYESSQNSDFNDPDMPNNESTYREITAGRDEPEEIEKVSYGDVYESEASQITGTENVGGLLKQVEHLRAAQEKINDLETEIEDLRRENDELLSAADTFKVLSEEYYEQVDRLKREMIESRETAVQENRILRESLLEREKNNNELKQSNADLKSKVETNFKQIRKRERDLEYRLEMAKVEETTLLKSKDKSILELRRKVDKLEQEMEAYREKNKEHYEKLQQQQQTVRGVVRALRIALTRLEGDFGVDFEVLKKAE